jgi:hypothetical protein
VRAVSLAMGAQWNGGAAVGERGTRALGLCGGVGGAVALKSGRRLTYRSEDLDELAGCVTL